MINQKVRFATEGIRFQRHNPDGTIATAQRFVGFSGTVDLTKALNASSRGDVTIKIDANPAETKSVDFALAVDKTKVTVAEAVEALEDADFTGITFSADSLTGRLKGSQAGGKVVQVIGPLAAALDFGQCVKHGGLGLVMISKFDSETVSIGLAKDIKDKEEIDSESADGTITRMVIGAMIQGISPVVVFSNKDYDLLEMIQGGKYDREANTYNPPLSKESEHPSFYGEIFSALYRDRSSNTKGNRAGYECILLRNMIGTEAEVPIEAKSFSQYGYNLVSTEYTETVGNETVTLPAWQEGTLTTEEFDALKVKEV